MRVVFDILGSTERSGGMRLHSTEMIKAWVEQWPEDEMTVVGPAWSLEEFAAFAQVRVWPNERALSRSLGQLVGSWQVARRARADALVSFSPIVSPFYRGTSVCFQHDWRHKLNPHEFPWAQRAYRRLWEVSARYASFNACISLKAQDETRRFVPQAETTLVKNGWDHARAWVNTGRSERGGQFVTFGHHNNKRPELVVAALAQLRRADGDHASRVTILGARGDYAAELVGLAARLGVDDAVDVPGFVSDQEYQTIVSNAGAVVMPSTDEGFGLPVAEALFLGIPAVVTDDSGMPEIFGDAVISVPPTETSLADAMRAIRAGARGAAAAEDMTTWGAAARALRGAIAQRSARED